MSALETQVAGNHYKQFKIQPIEFTMKNGLGFIEGNIIKYISRHKLKNGAEDIMKVKHYAELLLEIEYGIKQGVDNTLNKVVNEVATKEEISANELVEKILNHNIRKVLFKKLCHDYLIIDACEFVNSINSVVENHSMVEAIDTQLLSVCLK